MSIYLLSTETDDGYILADLDFSGTEVTLDLTDVDIDDVTQEDFYSLLIIFNESIRLKRNTVYTYQIEVPVTPTVEEPDPEPEIKDIYFYINKPFVDINISDLEASKISTSISDYGITGERLNIVTSSFRVLANAPDVVVTFSEVPKIFNEAKYYYLTSVAVSDLSYAKDIFHEIGLKYKWPEVSDIKANAIKNFIAEREEEFDEVESEAELEILLNSIKVSISRLFDPHLIPDEIV